MRFRWSCGPITPTPNRPSYWPIAEWLRASGPVSVQQSANILKRLGWQYGVIFGHEKEERARAELRAFLRAAEVKRGLKGTRILVLPAPCRVVVSTWVDEFFLLEKFGVELQYLSVDRFAQIAREIKTGEAREYARQLMASYPSKGVDDQMLEESARCALALVKITRDFGLSGIALEDFNEDFYRLLGFRPHLYHPEIGGMGCTIGFEADILNVLATVIVSRLAGHMGMFNEFFTIDPQANTVLMGHPGHGETRVADPATLMVTPDLEFDETQKRGAWLSYRARAGQMTFLNFTAEYGKLKAAAFQGEALAGPRIMEGYSHMLVKARPQVLRPVSAHRPGRPDPALGYRPWRHPAGAAGLCRLGGTGASAVRLGMKAAGRVFPPVNKAIRRPLAAERGERERTRPRRVFKEDVWRKRCC